MPLILHCNLGLTIRTKQGKGPVLTHRTQLPAQFVSQIYSKRHVRIGLIAGKTEHHALVSCTGFQVKIRTPLALHTVFQCSINALRNVGRLIADRCEHRTGIRIETVFGSIITHLSDGLANRALNINVSFRAHFTGHKDKTCCTDTFTCHPGLRILPQNLIQNRI